MTPIETYQLIQKCGYALPDIVDALIDACLQSVEDKNRELQLMACLAFDIWYRSK